MNNAVLQAAERPRGDLPRRKVYCFHPNASIWEPGVHSKSKLPNARVPTAAQTSLTHSTVITSTQKSEPDLFQWSTTLAPAVAWPLVVAVGIIVLRREIRSLLPSLTSIKMGAFEASFASQLESTSVKVLEAGSADPSSVAEITTQTDPRMIVLDSWSQLERGLSDLARSANMPISEGSSGLVLYRALEHAGILPRTLLSSLDELRQLRNAAASGAGRVTREQALIYAITADSIARQLKGLADLKLPVRDAATAHSQL